MMRMGIRFWRVAALVGSGKWEFGENLDFVNNFFSSKTPGLGNKPCVSNLTLQIVRVRFLKVYTVTHCTVPLSNNIPSTFMYIRLLEL